MGNPYHPIYESLWDDTKFVSSPDPWLDRAFFAFLCSHQRTRPAGIYPATAEVLAAETGRPKGWVEGSLARLAAKGCLRVEEGVVWVVKYLHRQPNKRTPNYKIAVVEHLKRIGLSHPLVQEFLDTYKTLGGALGNPRLRVGKPSPETSPHPPSSILHPPSSTQEQEPEKAVGAEPTGTAPAHPQDNGLPDWFREALTRSPTFSPLAKGHEKFWRAMSEAYDPYEWLKWDEEVQKADAWIAANPQRKPRALPRFLRNWFERTVERRRKEQHAQAAK